MADDKQHFSKIHPFCSSDETNDERRTFNPCSSHKSSRLLRDLRIKRPLSDQAAVEIVLKNPKSMSSDH